MMPSIHESIVRELDKLKYLIEGLDISYIYPVEWMRFPKITYSIEANHPSSMADDAIYTREIRVSLDIWATSLASLLKVSQLADDIMRNKLHMHQLWYQELKEPDPHLYRSQIKYVIVL